MARKATDGLTVVEPMIVDGEEVTQGTPPKLRITVEVNDPDMLANGAEPERVIGRSCINGRFLDELEPDRGLTDEVVPECSIFCELANHLVATHRIQLKQLNPLIDYK